MVPAIDPRRLIVLSGLTTACLLAATAIVADEPPRHDEPTAGRVVDELRLLDNETWFAHLLASEAESLSDHTLTRITAPQDTVPQIRPRVESPDDPLSPPTVRSTTDDASSQPPNVAAPNIAAPDSCRLTSPALRCSTGLVPERALRVVAGQSRCLETRSLTPGS